MKTRNRRGRTGPVLAAALLVALPLNSCSAEPADTNDVAEAADGEATASDAGTDPDNLTFEDISDDLESRVGEKITVTAMVEDVITPGVFTINAIDGNTLEPIAVVDARPGEDLEAGSEVVVTGTVHDSFIPNEVENLLDVQLEDELLSGYETRPYLRATEVRTDAS